MILLIKKNISQKMKVKLISIVVKQSQNVKNAMKEQVAFHVYKVTKLTVKANYVKKLFLFVINMT